MKIIKKELLGLAILLILAFVMLLIAPDASAWYINKKGRDLSGRPLSVEDLNCQSFGSEYAVAIRLGSDGIETQKKRPKRRVPIRALNSNL